MQTFLEIVVGLFIIGVVPLLQSKLRERREKRNAGKHKKPARISSKTLVGIMIAWPLFCIILLVIMTYQLSCGMENREDVDLLFLFFPQVFFFIGMGLCYSTVKRREQATAFVMATVVSKGEHWSHAGSSPETSYSPVYEYSVGDVLYRKSSGFSGSPCPVSKGQQVELFYVSGNPEKIYVPEEGAFNLSIAKVCCGFGFLFPLAALAAPLLR